MSAKYSGTPQVDLLFDHLIRRGSISPYEARDLYRVNSFHRRMADLVNLGVQFRKVRKTDNTGRSYVEYRLAGVNAPANRSK